MTHGRDEVLLLAREPELAYREAIHEIEAAAEHGRERDRDPEQQQPARRARQLIHAERELEIAERRREPRSVQRRAGKIRDRARLVRHSAGRCAQRRKRPASIRHRDVAHCGEAACAIRARDGLLDEPRAVDQLALDVPLPAAPDVAEHHDLAGVEHADLERIQLALERLHSELVARLGLAAVCRRLVGIALARGGLGFGHEALLGTLAALRDLSARLALRVRSPHNDGLAQFAILGRVGARDCLGRVGAPDQSAGRLPRRELDLLADLRFVGRGLRGGRVRREPVERGLRRFGLLHLRLELLGVVAREIERWRERCAGRARRGRAGRGRPWPRALLLGPARAAAFPRRAAIADAPRSAALPSDYWVPARALRPARRRASAARAGSRRALRSATRTARGARLARPRQIP